MEQIDILFNLCFSLILQILSSKGLLWENFNLIVPFQHKFRFSLGIINFSFSLIDCPTRSSSLSHFVFLCCLFFYLRPPYRDFSFGKNFDESNSLGEATGPPRDLHGVSGTNNGRELSAKLYPRIARDVVDDGPPLSTHRRREKSFIIELNIGNSLVRKIGRAHV